jgi:nucleoside-diphosphate-sugar epimerase
LGCRYHDSIEEQGQGNLDIHFRNALVTGGAGFIGSHLVEALLSHGCQVTVLDNLISGSIANLAHVKERIRFYKNDIREVDALTKAAAGCEVIFHLAAIVAVQQTIEHPIDSAMVNDIGTLNVLEAGRKVNARRVVFASSCAIYGDDPDLPKKETMTPKPLSPYAVQKLSAEHNARIYYALFGLETVSLRFFNVYGPRQDPSSPYSGVISIFMTKSASNQRPVIYGDGNQSRDFIFVEDVVRANLLAAQKSNLGGRVFNIGTGIPVTVNRLWELISCLSGRRTNPEHASARPGEVLHSVADIALANSALEFKCNVPLEEGLKKTFEWYCRQGAECR